MSTKINELLGRWETEITARCRIAEKAENAGDYDRAMRSVTHAETLRMCLDELTLANAENVVQQERMKKALESIRDTAKAHPCFDGDCFERRDIDELEKVGGDVSNWTLVAIEAEEGLQ